MLNKKECQIFIVSKIFQAKGETRPNVLNHLSGQIRALVAVISEIPAPFNDYLPDLLDFVGIPFTEEEGDIAFDVEWLKEVGFDLSDPFNPIHPKFNEVW